MHEAVGAGTSHDVASFKYDPKTDIFKAILLSGNKPTRGNGPASHEGINTRTVSHSSCVEHISWQILKHVIQ
jgi:hypothetical protein